MSDFKVVGHSYNSKLDKDGDIVTVFKVTLKNDDGDTMTKSSKDEMLFTDYALTSKHAITVTTPQQTLDDSIPVEEAVEETAEELTIEEETIDEP